MAYDVGARIGIEGEKEFKQAVSGINKDLSVFGSELKKVTAQFDTNSNSMDALRAKSDVYNKQIDAQKQKIETLKAALVESADKFGENDVKTKNWQIALNKAETDLAKTENALEQVNADLDQQGDKWEIVGKKMETIGGKFTNAGQQLRGLSIAAAGVVASLGAMAVKAAASADDINTLSKQTGLSTEEIQKYQYAAERIDVPLETLTGSMAKLTKSMESARLGSKNQVAAFEDLGISIFDVNGGLRNNQDVFAEAIEVLSKLENSTERDALAMQIFGKSAQDLNPLILGGADALKQYGEEAEAAGLILSQDVLDSANEFNDAMDKMKATAESAAMKIGSSLAPTLIPLIEQLANVIDKVMQELAGVNPNVLIMVGGIALLVAALAPVLTAIGSIITIAPVLGAAIAALSGPVGVFIALLAGAVAAGIVLVKNWDEIKAWASEKWGAIKDTISEKVSEMKENVKTNWEEIKTSTSDKWEEIKTSTSEAWTKVKDFMSENGEGILLAATGPAGWAVKLGKTIYENWDSIKNKTSEAFGNMSSAISEKMEDAKTFVSEKLADIGDAFDELPGKALAWGKNMIQGFIDGINAKIKAVKNAVSNITSAAADFLGFNSPAKKGEGRFIVDWGENMIDGFLDGVKSKISDVNSTIGSVTAATSSLATPPSSAVRNNYSAGGGLPGTNNTVNVYVQQLSEAQQDYLFRKFNARLGVV